MAAYYDPLVRKWRDEETGRFVSRPEEGQEGGVATAPAPTSTGSSDRLLKELIGEVRKLRETVKETPVAPAFNPYRQNKELKKLLESLGISEVLSGLLATTLAIEIAIAGAITVGLVTLNAVKNPANSGLVGLVTGASGLFEKPAKDGDKIGGYTVTSPFGMRTHPIHGDQRMHKGVDLDTPEGVDLYMFAGGGSVECLDDPEGWGTYAVIKPKDSPYEFLAAHLSKCQSGEIPEGQVYAETGNTGGSTGPHLHWEQHKDGEAIEPTQGWLYWTLTGNKPPDSSPGGSVAAVEGSGELPGLNAEQSKVAWTIIETGSKLGASQRDLEVAIATAMQESTLENLDWGDRDSVGVFQQRPSQDWGTVEELTNVSTATERFFKGHGTNPGLFDIEGRESMALTEAAQAVQRSGFPSAFAKHEGLAREVVSAALGE